MPGNMTYPARMGADLTSGPVEQVALDRLSGAKLTFTGRRIARHAQNLPWGEGLSITLWARQKAGFVVGFQVFSDGRLRAHAAGTDTLDDAICFLEDFCTRLPEPSLHGESYEQTIVTLQRAISFRSSFLTLVGEALAAWVDLPDRLAGAEKPGKKSQQKANA